MARLFVALTLSLALSAGSSLAQVPDLNQAKIDYKAELILTYQSGALSCVDTPVGFNAPPMQLCNAKDTWALVHEVLDLATCNTVEQQALDAQAAWEAFITAKAGVADPALDYDSECRCKDGSQSC